MTPAADPTALFAQSEADFAAGRLGEARAKLDRVLPLIAAHPAVLHLSGLVHRRMGAAERAVADLAAASGLAPGDAQIANNLGNALSDCDRLSDATAAYRRAVQLAPDNADARRNLAQSLCDAEDWPAALREAEVLTAACPDDARGWSTLGRAALGAGSLDRAETGFDRALSLDATMVSALSGRATLALRRGDTDSHERHRVALTRAPENAALMLGWVQSDPTDEAMDRLADRLRAHPDWLEGHRTYARLASERGEPADASLAEARVARPDDATLALTQLVTVMRAGEAERALALVDALPDAWRGAQAALEVEGEAAMSLGDHARDRSALERLAARDPTAAALPLARLALREGRPDRAAATLDPLVETGEADVTHWAHLSLAWRMMGDEREEWLHGGPGLIATAELPLGADELGKLAALLCSLHRARAHPIGQSMRGGTQTPGRLFERRDPGLARLKAALDRAVAEHRAALPPADPRHPVLRHRDRPWTITGSWSVRLSGAGFHVNHVHPNGVISSACYIALPDRSADADPRAGRLSLGEAPAELDLALAPVRVIEPAPGRLALFPSTLFHGTVPFSAGERLTVAFDVAAQ